MPSSDLRRTGGTADGVPGLAGAGPRVDQGLEADNTKTYWQANRSTYQAPRGGRLEELLAELADDFGNRGGCSGPTAYCPPLQEEKTPYKLTCAADVSGGGISFSADPWGLFVSAAASEMPGALQGARPLPGGGGPRRSPVQKLESIVATLRQAGDDVEADETLKNGTQGRPQGPTPVARAGRSTRASSCPGPGPVGPWLSTRRAKDRVVACLQVRPTARRLARSATRPVPSGALRTSKSTSQPCHVVDRRRRPRQRRGKRSHERQTSSTSKSPTENCPIRRSMPTTTCTRTGMHSRSSSLASTKA